MIRLKHQNDTKMITLNQRENRIIEVFLERGELQSSDVHKNMLAGGEDVSLVTIKRALSDMVKKNLLIPKGSGRSTSYTITSLGRILARIDVKEYISEDPDKRYGLSNYNFDLFSSFPKELFPKEELDHLNSITKEYAKKVKELTPVIQKKELERLIIDLSWKSSKIEGNTYTLLDTERLILENEKAEGKTKEEAQMILNHKDAFFFIIQNKESFKKIRKKDVEEIHRILVKGLNVSYGLRKNPVGISGSKYLPLDNVYQIEEALDILLDKINKTRTPFSKSLLSILGLSYIQPFEDGNKRTSRLLADAILLAERCAPLSYRNINGRDYREAIIAFYKINSIIPFKNIFISQYEFATKNYAVK